MNVIELKTKINDGLVEDTFIIFSLLRYFFYSKKVCNSNCRENEKRTHLY